MKIEELVKWSEPETIQTKAGEKTVRKAAYIHRTAIKGEERQRTAKD